MNLGRGTWSQAKSLAETGVFLGGSERSRDACPTGAPRGRRKEEGGRKLVSIVIIFMCMFDSYSCCPIHFMNLAAITPEFP